MKNISCFTFLLQFGDKKKHFLVYKYKRKKLIMVKKANETEFQNTSKIDVSGSELRDQGDYIDGKKI